MITNVKLIIYGLLIALFCGNSTNAYAQWRHYEEPNINTLAYANNQCFAGTDSGLIQSEDDGQTWKDITSTLSGSKINGLLFWGDRLYAATQLKGIFYSIDKGKTWTEINNGIPPFAKNVFVFYVSGNTLLAGTRNGVYYSLDSGTTWISSDLTNKDVKTIHKSGQYLLAGSSNGPFYSTNNGINWIFCQTGFYIAFHAFLECDSNLFAGSANFGLYVSKNNGLIWTQCAQSGIPTTSTINAFNKSGTALFAGLVTGVYKSLNNGSTWNICNVGTSAADKISTIVNKDSTLILGTYAEAKILRSKNYGISFVTQKTGLRNCAVRHIIQKDSFLFAATPLGVFISSNFGKSWREVNTGLRVQDAIRLANIDSILFVGCSHSGGVFRSTNYGKLWTEANSGIIGSLSILSFAKMSSYFFVGTENYGVFKTNNNGGSWIEANADGMSGKNVFSLVTMGSNLFAGNGGGPNEGVYLSTDTGVSWIEVNNGLESKSVYILCVSGTTIYTTSGTHSYFSNNMGANWSVVDSSLPAAASAFISIDSNVFGYVQRNGVYLSRHSDGKWLQVNSGLPVGLLQQKADINIVDTTLFLWSTGYGLYTASVNSFNAQQTNINATSDVLQKYQHPYLFCTEKGVYYVVNSPKNFIPKNDVSLSLYKTNGMLVCKILISEAINGSYFIPYAKLREHLVAKSGIYILSLKTPYYKTAILIRYSQ